MSQDVISENRQKLRRSVVEFNDVYGLRPAVYGLTNSLQGKQPAHQLLSLGIALHLLCGATGVPLRDVMSTCSNMVSSVDSPFSNQMKALEAYARGEILGGTQDAFG